MKTPVVFLIFRRPDLTAQVFEAIRQAQPAKLLIVADGARNEEEAILCQQTRAVTEQIDWDCEVLRNYSDVNLGCRERVASGITWAFEQVEEAIILEDDCLPHPDFFRFCSELLAHYRHDTRIWNICGHNFQDAQWRGDGSYYFSRYADPWGWATWKRAWKHYDKDLNDWQDFLSKDLSNQVFEASIEVEHWNQILNCMYFQGKPNTWDYQWLFTCWKNSGFSISPNINLISNLGFRDDATHTRQEGRWANMDVNEIGEIKHPQFILRNKDADEYYFHHRQNGLYMIEQKQWNKRLMFQLSRIKRKLTGYYRKDT